VKQAMGASWDSRYSTFLTCLRSLPFTRALYHPSLLSSSSAFICILSNVKVVWTLMARWWEEEGAPWDDDGPRAGEGIRILDMAAGR
jgi:hypothetical protein